MSDFRKGIPLGPLRKPFAAIVRNKRKNKAQAGEVHDDCLQDLVFFLDGLVDGRLLAEHLEQRKAGAVHPGHFDAIATGRANDIGKEKARRQAEGLPVGETACPKLGVRVACEKLLEVVLNPQLQLHLDQKGVSTTWPETLEFA